MDTSFSGVPAPVTGPTSGLQPPVPLSGLPLGLLGAGLLGGGGMLGTRGGGGMLPSAGLMDLLLSNLLAGGPATGSSVLEPPPGLGTGALGQQQVTSQQSPSLPGFVAGQTAATPPDVKSQTSASMIGSGLSGGLRLANLLRALLGGSPASAQEPGTSTDTTTSGPLGIPDFPSNIQLSPEARQRLGIPPGPPPAASINLSTTPSEVSPQTQAIADRIVQLQQQGMSDDQIRQILGLGGVFTGAGGGPDSNILGGVSAAGATPLGAPGSINLGVPSGGFSGAGGGPDSSLGGGATREQSSGLGGVGTVGSALGLGGTLAGLAGAPPGLTRALQGAGAAAGLANAISGLSGGTGAAGGGAGAAAGTSAAGTIVPALGGALQLGLTADQIAKMRGLSDSEKAALAANAAAVQSAMVAGDIVGFGIPSIVDAIVQAAGGPSATSFATKMMADLFGFGPSREFMTFPSRAVGGLPSFAKNLSQLGSSVVGAKTIPDLQRDIDAFKAAIRAGTGGTHGFGGVGGFGAGFGPLDLPPLPEIGKQIHGADIPRQAISASRQIQNFEQMIRNLVGARRAQLLGLPAPPFSPVPYPNPDYFPAARPIPPMFPLVPQGPADIGSNFAA